MEGSLEALLEVGRTAWPGIEVDPSAFAAYVAARAGDGKPITPLAADLFIACACSNGAPVAIAAFEEHFVDAIVHAVRALDPSPRFADDVRQAVLEKLFVAQPGASPKIVEYAGRGPLRVWLRAVALRAALRLRRSKEGPSHDALGEPDVWLAGEAENRLPESQREQEAETSVRAAVRHLTTRERALLRFHLVDGMNIDEISLHYGVGRLTAEDWLGSARKALRDGARADMMKRLHLAESELESVTALVRSRVEACARPLLAEA